MAVTCTHCGLRSEVAEAFAGTGRTHGAELLCPSCYREHDRGFGAGYLLTFAGMMIACGVAVAVRPDWQLGWIILNIGLLVAFESLLILPHELGHALSARAMGMRVFELAVGSGRTVWQGRIAGVKVILGAIPLGGYCRAAPRWRRLMRTQIFVYTLGGLLASVLLVAAVLLFVSPAELNRNVATGLGSRLLPAEAFVGANLVVLVTNILPGFGYTESGKVTSDGMKLLITPFLSRGTLDSYLRETYSLDARRALERGEYAGAFELFGRALAGDPGRLDDRQGQAEALLRQGDYAGARDRFLDLAEAPQVPPGLRMAALDHLAEVDVLLEDPDLLDEAERASGIALAQTPWRAKVRGTCGMVAVAKGEIARGIDLLTDAVAAGEVAAERAVQAVFLARAYAARGEPDKQRSWLHRARELDPDSVVLRRLARDAGRGSGGPP